MRMCHRCHHDPISSFDGLCKYCVHIDEQKAKLQDAEDDAEDERVGSEASASTDSRDLLATEGWFLPDGNSRASVMQPARRTVVTVPKLFPGRREAGYRIPELFETTGHRSPKGRRMRRDEHVPTTPIPDWDTFFLGLAEYYSQRSKDPSTKVGAVIVDDWRRVVALGYNGFPRGIEDSEERLNDRDVKYEYMVHGEINAILNASGSVRGCTLYTFPFAPCAGCAPLVIQAGIRRVVTLSVTGELNDRWGESHRLAMRMFSEADVEVTYL